MKNRILRLALVVLAVAGQTAAGFFVFQKEQAHGGARDRLAVLTRDAAVALSIVGELRGAQTGMVALGQDPAFWVQKVSGLAEKVAGRLRDIDPGTLAPEAAQDRAAAMEALAAFGRNTDRVRDLLATDQPLTASSLVFGEAADRLSTASGAVASIPTTQRLVTESQLARDRRLQVFALLGAGAFTMLVMLVLLPRVRQVLEDPAALSAPGSSLGLSLGLTTPADIDILGRSGFDLDISKAPVPLPGDPLPEPPRESEVEIVDDLKREGQLRLNTEAQVDLAKTARLCGDLARLNDGAELPAMLARAAEILDAAGIVVWIAEAGRAVLRPAASHGYSEHTMAKMKALPVSAENPVSLAVRGGRMEVVLGSRERNGAIVSPINAAGGCAGAIAVEIRHGAESSPAVQAVAAIISAQLASLVAETAHA